MSGTVAWKHIGLYNHSVGTFACEADRILWKSAVTGQNDDDDAISGSSRSLPKQHLQSPAQWTVFGRSGHLRILTKPGSNLKHEFRFDGFPSNDFDKLKQVLSEKYGIDMETLQMSAAGTQYGLATVKGKKLVFRHCVLDEMNEEGQEFEPRAEEEMMSLDLAEVSQCVLPGTNRNEIELQFPESDAVEAGTDQLVAIRFYIPPDPDVDAADKDTPTAAEKLQQRIMQTANIRKTTGDVIVSFEQAKGTFLTPRGRYLIELYDYFVRLRGQKYDYKIKYDDINRLFLLPKPDEVHMAFVIALDKPIRQGQQRYQYLVLQASKEPDEVTVNLDDDTLQKEYNGELQPVMRGSLSNLIAKTFKVIAKKKVFIPGKFANANQHACVKCAVRANEGLLYPLEKQFVFIHKPPILIRFNEIESVEFQRYAGGQGSTRNFDLCVNLKTSVTGGTVKEYTFSGIDRSDYTGLYNFLSSKKIPIKNLQGSAFLDDAGPPRKGYTDEEIYGGPVDDMPEEESEDEDFDEEAAAREEAEAAGSGSGSDDDLDDDELGSEVDEELDSDLEEARKETKKRPKKQAAPAPASDSDKDEDDDDEADASPKKKRKTKAKKDPNAPKRAMTAYFFFMNANRDKVKEKNPDLSFAEIGKQLGAEWKALSAEEKVKYEKMAAGDKVRYQNEMKDYKPPPGESSPEGKKKQKQPAKKKKDPNAPKRNMTSFFFFSNEMREKVKKENPGITFGELGKKIGEMFRALPSDEKEKYEKMAADDKNRYKKEMADYKETTQKAQNEDDGVDDDDDDDDDDSDDSD